jgi:hypothetical protein
LAPPLTVDSGQVEEALQTLADAFHAGSEPSYKL